MLGLGSALVGGTTPSKTPQTFTFQMEASSVSIPAVISEYDVVITGVISRNSSATDDIKYTANVLLDGIDTSSADINLGNAVRLNGTATLTATRASTDYTVTLYMYASTPESSQITNISFSPLAQSTITAAERTINADDFTPNLPDLTDGQVYPNLDSYSLVLNAIDPDPVIDSDTYDATDSSPITQPVTVVS